MGGMVSKAVTNAASSPPSGGKSSPAPQNAYGSAYQAPTSTSAPAQTPTASIGQAAQNLVGPQPSAGGGKSSGMGASGYGMPIQDQMSAPQSQPFTPMPMMGGGKSSGLGQGGYGMAPAFQQPQQQFNPFQQQQFNPFQQQQFNPFQQQQFNPFQQQFGGFQQQPQGASGLQALFNNMMGQQQQMQQPMQQMPRFQSQALQFRPNMQNAQAALSRVKPSVQKQQQDAQAARIAELEAQLAGYNTPSGE